MAVNFVKQNNLKIDWILPSFGVSLCKFIFSKNLLCQTVFLWSEFWVKRHLHKQIPQNRKIQSILWFFCFIKVAAEFPRILLHMKPKVRQIWRFLICVYCKNPGKILCKNLYGNPVLLSKNVIDKSLEAFYIVKQQHSCREWLKNFRVKVVAHPLKCPPKCA